MGHTAKVYLPPTSQIIETTTINSSKRDSFALGYVVQMINKGTDADAIKVFLSGKGYK